MVTYTAVQTSVLAFVSDPDARVLVAIFAAVPSLLAGVSAWNSIQSKKALRPNGGSTPADAIGRIEHAVKDLSKRLTAVEDYITNPKENQ